MWRALGTLLARLQNRPLEERRVLALTTYLGTAAIVISLWLTSFQENFISPSGGTIAELGTAGLIGAEPKAPASPSGLSSPFKAVAESAANAWAELKNLARRLDEAGLVLPAPEATAIPGGAEGTTDPQTKSRMSEAAPAEAVPPKLPPSTAAVLAAAMLDAPPYPAAALAELLRPPEGKRGPTPQLPDELPR